MEVIFEARLALDEHKEEDSEAKVEYGRQRAGLTKGSIEHQRA